jgi:aromatic-L-amino-acid/L-tryptophan decarboxylase
VTTVSPDADLDHEPTDTTSFGAALARLLPALDRAVTTPPTPGYPAYLPTDPGPLPDDGIGVDGVVDELATMVAHGSSIGSPGWMGFITTGSTTTSALAHAAVGVAGGQRYMYHSFNRIEHVALRWLAELCGIPADAAGVFAAGGSTANLLALGAARQAAYEQLGVDVGENGPGDAPPGRIYASRLAHRTIHRSAAVLGLGRQAVVELPTDRAGRIDVTALDAAIARDVAAGIVPIAVVAIAGTTDTGSVDSIRDTLAVARAHGTWLHVDGAYGLVAHASPQLAPLFDRVGEADSWIVDPHKWLATGVGVAAAYVRDGGVLTRAFAEGHAAYLEGAFGTETPVSQFDGMAAEWADQSVELSSPPRGVMAWAVLREIGRAGVARRVERHVALARRLADAAVAHPRLELLCEPDLSIVCFRYVGTDPGADLDAINRRILTTLRRETVLVPTSTEVDGQFAIRPCLINPRITTAEVDGLAAAVVEIGDRLCA